MSEQLLHDEVRTERHIHHFLGIGTPAVPNGVVAGKADAEKIGRCAAAEIFGVNGSPRQIQQQLVTERRIAQRLVVEGGESALTAHQRVRKGSSLSEAFAFADNVVWAAVTNIIQIGPQPPPALAEPAVG